MKPVSAHAYPEYVDHPWHIFTAFASRAFQDDLNQEITRARDMRSSIPKHVLDRLVWYPSLMAILIRRGILNRDEIEHHLTNPATRFRVMVEDYASLAPLLEVKCLQDLETTERIRRWALLSKRPTHHPIATYQHVLSQDPVRALRMTAESQRPPPATIAVEASRDWQNSPGWAFLYVSHVGMREISPEVVEVLAESEEYSYLAANNFSMRKMPMSAWINTLNAIKSPRWAFLVLRYIDLRVTLPQDLRKRMLDIVLSSPAFAVQLWVDRRVTGAALAMSHRECLARSAGHPLTPELNSWLAKARGAGLLRESEPPLVAMAG